VHLTLKILTAHRDRDEENGDHEEDILPGKDRADFPVLAGEFERMGLECMQRVVLAVLEDTSEVVDDISLAGIQGNNDSNERYIYIYIYIYIYVYIYNDIYAYTFACLIYKGTSIVKKGMHFHVYVYMNKYHLA
jgi:hypothetical protein